MKVDITRNTFSPQKQFRRVLMQQGRVQLDADWNEQAALLLDYLQTLAADIIGPAGGPAGPNLGFEFDSLPGVFNDFAIGAGRYYVNGLLVEILHDTTTFVISDTAKKQIKVNAWSLDGTSFAKGQYVHLAGPNVLTQIVDTDQPSMTLTVGDVGGGAANTVGTISRMTTYLTQPAQPDPIAPGNYNATLDVWEQEITYAQDDSIREIALNGAETCARSKLMWQVRLVSTKIDNPAFVLAATASIKAVAKQTTGSQDPCTISASARYRGAQNQLYRVEIHDAGTKPTFKWSRENGSVIFPILRASAKTVVLESLGRDDRFGLAEGDWVEAVDDTSPFRAPGALLQVQAIDSTTRTVTLSGTPSITVAAHALLRRWDQTDGDPNAGGTELANGVVPIVTDSATWINLENGIQVQFQKPQTGAVVYNSGDYWLIPARTATGDIEWPEETDKDAAGVTTTSPLAKPPDGIVHSLALLAEVDATAAAAVTVTDHRKPFKPMA
jgi:Family of unknown function (DUF6519)